MKKNTPQSHPVLRDVERMIHLETELTRFNNERSLQLAESRLTVTPIGGTTLLSDELSPQSSYYNRVIGFGPSDLDRLPEILGIYEAAGIDPCFDMSPDRQTGEVAEALASKGFVPRLQLAFLKNERIGKDMGRDLSEGFPSLTKIEISLISNEEEAISFIRLIERSYLANDFTFPGYRRRGVQTAMIRHRLQAAAALGLKRVYTDVEFASASHANMLKSGFELVYMNAFWMKSALPQ